MFILTSQPSLTLAAPKKNEPIVIQGPQIGDAQIVGLFATFQEYRDLVTVLTCVGAFCLREYYQFRKDRDQVAAQQKKSEKFEIQISEMEKSQGRIEQSLKHLTEIMKQQNRATDGRLQILERKL